MTKVTLHKVRYKKRPCLQVDGEKTKYRHAWMLRWYSTNGKHHAITVGDCKKVTKREAERARRDKQSKLDCSVESPDKPTKMALKDFRPYYIDRRRQGENGRGYLRGSPCLLETTVVDHDMVLRYRIEHFGERQAIGGIKQAGAVAFVDALAAGKLAGARAVETDKREIGPQRVRGVIRLAKAILNWAVRFGFSQANPFADFDSAPLDSADKYYLSLADFEKLVTAAEAYGDGWPLLLAICRLAGLRRDEARTLPWNGKAVDANGKEHEVGVDWERRRLRLVGTQKGARSRRFREVPICPRLYDMLLAAFDAAPDGQETVTGLSSNNLTRTAQAIARKAGLTVWPKFYNALRASCEQDWKTSGVAEPTYCTWIGHGAGVSRDHYVSPTDGEFAEVTS